MCAELDGQVVDNDYQLGIQAERLRVHDSELHEGLAGRRFRLRFVSLLEVRMSSYMYQKGAECSGL